MDRFFYLQLGPLPSAQFSRPLSGITVDDNLASVFIFLSSSDNDRGTKAIEKLWEDEHSHTEEKKKKSTFLQREFRPQSRANLSK